jgi:acetate kinase
MVQPAGQAILPRVLTVNTGSSSLKLGLYGADVGDAALISGEAQRIGRSGARLRFVDGQQKTLRDETNDLPDHGAALRKMVAAMAELLPDQPPQAIGHRIVHGGKNYREPGRITPEMVAALTALVPLVPQHLPQAIACIQLAGQLYPDLPQVACFDTSFHRNMPRLAQIYPLPLALEQDGVIRYGFHGLSYDYILHTLRATAPGEAEGRLIIAHLGNGASMAAVRGGVGIDTTMGFTPTGGLMMGTRAGDLDPGVLLYLLTEKKLTPAAMSDLVNRQSGLLGVSGTSLDVRDLLASEATDPHAADALGLFCYQAKKFIGALAAVLGGLDTLVFTAGIGEHAAEIRWRICEGLDFLGVRLNAQRNNTNAAVISEDKTPVNVRVIETDEDTTIVRHTREVLKTT